MINYILPDQMTIICENACLYRFNVTEKSSELTIFDPVIVARTQLQDKIQSEFCKMIYIDKNKPKETWQYNKEGKVSVNANYFRVWLKHRDDDLAKILIKDAIDNYYYERISKLNEKIKTYRMLRDEAYNTLTCNIDFN